MLLKYIVFLYNLSYKNNYKFEIVLFKRIFFRRFALQGKRLTCLFVITFVYFKNGCFDFLKYRCYAVNCIYRNV